MSEESLLDPDGEYSPIHRNLPRLRSGIMRNPFSCDENNDESLVYLKIGNMKSNSVSAKSLSNSKILEGDKNKSLSKIRSSRDSDTESAISSRAGTKK